jgi:hypothetical protein
MKLVELRDLLLSVGVPVCHFESTGQADKYIVWAEEGSGESVYADDQLEIQATQGTIDYFTKTEFDLNFNHIPELINSSDATCRLNSIQREKDTGYIHYEWIWEVDGIGEDVNQSGG